MLQGIRTVVAYTRTSRTLARADAEALASAFLLSCPIEKMVLQILDPKI